MSKQTSFDDYTIHYDISIRNEYTRFACMFYLFTFLAFLTTVLLFIFANNSYNNESELIQRRFIPYSILGILSLILFFIFFLGSLVYTTKLIRKFRLKPSSNPTTDITDNLTQITTKSKPMESFLMNTDESYYTNAKILAEQKSRTIDLTSHPYQTDV